MVDNPWNGGAGLSYEEVGRMSPDQVYHRLCDEKVLKVKGGRRTAEAQPLTVRSDERGLVKGRAEDGTPIVARLNVGGKSLTRRLMEEEEEKEKTKR